MLRHGMRHVMAATTGFSRRLSSKASVVDVGLMSGTPQDDATWAAKLLKMPQGSFTGTAPSVGSPASPALSFLPGLEGPTMAFPHCVVGVSNFDSALRDAKKRGGVVLFSDKTRDDVPPYATIRTPGGAVFTVIHRYRRAPIASVVLLVKDVSEAADFWERCVGLERQGEIGSLSADAAAMDAALSGAADAGTSARAWVDAPEAAAPVLPPLELLHASAVSAGAPAESLAGRQWCVMSGGSPRTSTSVVLLQSRAGADEEGAGSSDAMRWATGDAVVTVRVPSVSECYGWIIRRPETEVDPDFDEAAAAAAASQGSAPRHPQNVDTRVAALWATDLDGNVLRIVQSS